MQTEIQTEISNAPIQYNRKKHIVSNLKKYKSLYLMTVPAIVYYIIFKFIPLGGIVIAFQDYNIFKGIFGSDFVGFKNFMTMFKYGDFIRMLKNSLMISFYDLIIGFPAPIILALILNEVRNKRFKSVVQQTIYLPHFLSWVILGGIITEQVLSPSEGILNKLLVAFGQDPIYFLTQEKYARGIVILSGLWKDVGWGTIIYLAALAGVNPSLYEAASIDGAGKFRQLISITLPSLMPTVVTMFLLKIGHFLDFGFERVYVFLNGANRSTIEIFDTYIYQVGLLDGRFSYTTAVGLFKAVVGLVLIVIGNKLSKKFTGEGLY